MSVIDVWYLPTNYGDIRLEAMNDGDVERTRVLWYRLTPEEAGALQHLRGYGSKGRRKWAAAAAWEGLPIVIGGARETSIDLDAPLRAVADQLNAQLRPEREKVHIVRIGNGRIDELSQSRFASTEPEVSLLPEADPPADPANGDTTALAKTGTDGETAPVKATTVVKPTRGCPAPAFEEIRRRATQVLRAFMTPQQVSDFERYQRFMVRGGATGHAYMLTSRNAPGELLQYGGRTVYDCDEHRPFCVHEWDVPAEEELLTMAALLSLPQYEHWVREIPDGALLA